MKKFKFLDKISIKITISFAITFILILLALNVIIYFSIKSHIDILETSLINSRKDITFEEVSNILKENPNLDDSNINEIISSVTTHKDPVYVNLRFPNRVFRSYTKVTLPFTIDLSDIGEFNFKQLNGKDNRYFYLNTPITTSNGEVIYIQFINDLKNSDSLLDALISTMLIIDIIGFLLAIVYGYFFAKRTLKPISTIADTAEKINLHNLNKRIETSNNNDEIGRLIKVMNDMMERLEASFENQNKFISDASHELRTPLSIINGYVDLLKQWGTSNKELTEEALTSIKDEVFNMTDLIEKLLFIAREENTRQKLELTDVNIPNLIHKIYKEFKMIDPKHKYVLEESPEFYAFIDEKLILQGIRALIENAVKYTPKNKTITLGCKKGNSYFKIIIKDEGIGIPKDDIPKLFGRFYRVDEARTKETGGNGLGLSIVKSIIDMHNGNILIESEINKGTTITLKIPI